MVGGGGGGEGVHPPPALLDNLGALLSNKGAQLLKSSF